MKTMDRLYERLTPAERFQIAMAAFGRGDLAEVDRLNDTTAWHAVNIQEPAYFDRLQRITWLGPYAAVQARGLQSAALATFFAIVAHVIQYDAGNTPGGAPEQKASRFDDLCGICEDKVARLKAVHSAWNEFCTGLGISATDLDTMFGMPLLGGLGYLDLVDEIVGEIPLDEDYRQECLGHLNTFWKTKISDRYPS
jgi:hypothetical protein